MRADVSVKPIKLHKSNVKYLFGASVKTHFDQWKEDATTHRGMPSELVSVPEPVVNKGTDTDGDYSEIVVPDVFEPGSIMLFQTEMPVSFSRIARDGH